MFTAFDKGLLLKEVAELKVNSQQPKQQTTNLTINSNIFISEGDLPERFTLILKKFDDHFIFKQSRHIIDLVKGDSLLDNFINSDITGISGVLVNMFGQLKSDERFQKYKTKTGNLMIPCLVDVESYCPICNLIQTMRIISSQNFSELNDKSEYYELVDVIHKVSELILQTFYRIENYVMVGIIYDEQLQSAEIKILNTSNNFFNGIVSKVSEYLKEQGLLLYDIDTIGIKILGKSIDRFNYEIEGVTDIFHNIDVIEFSKHKGFYDVYSQYVNEWHVNRVRTILHRRTLEQISAIESDFSSLIDSSIELIIDIIKEQLQLLS